MTIKRKILAVLLALALLLGQTASIAFAGSQPPDPCKFFYGSVGHTIDGTKLGLSQEFPLVVEIYYGPNLKLFKSIPLSYRELYHAQFPRGQYLVKFYSVELQSYVDTMEVFGEVPGCSKVILKLRLIDGVPVTTVLIREMIT